MLTQKLLENFSSNFCYFTNDEIRQSEKLNVVPVWLLAVYPILVSLDLFTTYLATPDLFYEHNAIIKSLNLTWRLIIPFVFLVIILTVFFTFKANAFFKKCGRCTTINKNKIFFVGYFLIIWWLYTHITYSFYVIFNNAFSYLYLYNIECGRLSKWATSYVKYYQENPMHHTLTILLACFLGVVVAFWRIRRLTDDK